MRTFRALAVHLNADAPKVTLTAATASADRFSHGVHYPDQLLVDNRVFWGDRMGCVGGWDETSGYLGHN